MTDTIRTAGTVGESIVDGPGIRFVLFTQGCPHRCPGCHNAHTHDPSGGKDYTADELLKELARYPLSGGVTLSGGEPFAQAAALVPFAQAVRAQKKHIMIYSGYTFEELLQMGEDARALLACADLLVDGRYEQAARDLTLRFRGSANQRVLDVQQSLAEGAPVWAEQYR